MEGVVLDTRILNLSTIPANSLRQSEGRNNPRRRELCVGEPMFSNTASKSSDSVAWYEWGNKPIFFIFSGCAVVTTLAQPVASESVLIALYYVRAVFFLLIYYDICMGV